jgi:antitoxin ParD1/3/4
MSIQITTEIEQLVESIYVGGNYRDETAVLDAALRLLKQRDQLLSDVQAGIAQLDAGQGIDGEGVFNRLEEQARRIQQSAKMN